jgi:hypothetical protein
VKHLRLLIPMCGAALIVVHAWAGLDLAENTLHAVMLVASLLLATAIGVLGVARPPLQPWHAALALVGFAVAAVRTRVWRQLAGFGDAPALSKIAILLVLVGVLASAIAMLRPEPATDVRPRSA